MNLCITGETIDIKPVDEKSINTVMTWYNEHDAYGFATGRKSIRDAFNVNKNSFVSGIYTKDRILVGLVIGEIKRVNETVLWIRTFLIDRKRRRQSLGTNAFNLLSEHVAENFNVKRIYLSVSAINRAGIGFWTKMGMSCVKTVKTAGHEKGGEILIFEKVLQP